MTDKINQIETDEIKFILSDLDGQPFSEMDFIPDTPEFEEYHLLDNFSIQQEFFIEELFAAFDSYHKSQDWLALSDSIWSLFVKHHGFHKVQPDTKHIQVHQEFGKMAKQSFINAISYLFNEFYKLSSQDAIYALSQLLGTLKADMDYESLCASLTDEEHRKYDFFIRRMQDEISIHEKRPNVLVQKQNDQEQGTVPKNFKSFCIMKIDQMSPDECKQFLSINKGDGSFYDNNKNWATEYCELTGKKPLKNPGSQLSNAKREYRKLKSID